VMTDRNRGGQLEFICKIVDNCRNDAEHTSQVREEKDYWNNELRRSTRNFSDLLQTLDWFLYKQFHIHGPFTEWIGPPHLLFVWPYFIEWMLNCVIRE
jgi:hypothetical protein